MAVMTCVGSLIEVLIRHANRPDDTRTQGHFEIISLVAPSIRRASTCV